jgi:predicted choloylglycine hydrolase
MYHTRVKGTYYEMGYKYGTMLYKHGFRVPEQSTERLDFGTRCEKEVERIFPEILEEIRGFAKACRTPYEQLAAFVLSVGAVKPKPTTCSVFAAFDGSDIIFGRNYDFYYSFKDKIESYLTCPKDGYWSLGQSDIFIGREDGINEKGLAIGMTAVKPKVIKPGINFAIATRYILDKYDTVEEALQFLSGVHFLTANNYLLTDKDGRMAVVEASPDKVRLRRPEEGTSFLVCTNHFMHSEMLAIENKQERPLDSVNRYTAIYDALKLQKGKIDARLAEKILSNHSGYVCSHVDSIQLGTLWSVVATLKNLQIFRAEGHPCKTKYKQDLRLKKALQNRQ